MALCMRKKRAPGSRQTPGGAVRPGVSMPEVLLVISIVAFMLALLIPGLGSVKERARRLQCKSNLHQWGMALQFYRDDNRDYLPTEGTYLAGGLLKRHTWYNALPPYIGAPSYADVAGVNYAIKEFPNVDVWICPSKNLTAAFKSGSGKNQFHYGMNQVLDGLGAAPNGSRDAPGYPDLPNALLPGKLFARKPNTVFMFDIAPNSPAGSPRNVATEYARGFRGERLGKFHGDYANFLHLSGSVAGFRTADLVEDNDLRHGAIVWDHPRLYWGYPPPSWQ